MEYFTRLRKFWFQDFSAFLWLLLAIPIMISFQSTVHEGTHGMAAFLNTWSFPKIIPFLMDYDGEFHNGFTVQDASTEKTYTERKTCDERERPASNTRLAGWSGWPQVGAFLITVGIALIFLFVKITNPVIGLLWRAWYVAACVDFLSNTALILFGTCIPGKDWAAAMIQGDHGFIAFRIVTLLLWLIVLSHFVWVCWSKWGTEPLPDRGFWNYRWLAFVLGILSTISLIFYMLVRDDGIGYGSFWYVGGLILQFAGFWFYWIYYGSSLKRREE
jgi:hypothetical protein